MVIEELLGLTKKEIKNLDKSNIVSENNVNSTIEFKNIKSRLDNNFHNVLFYFDLADNTTMTMAVVKFEDLDIMTKMKLKMSKDLECKDYIGNVTFNNKKEAVLAYVHKNVIKRI